MDADTSIHIAGYKGLTSPEMVQKFQGAGYHNLIPARHDEQELTGKTAVERFF